MTDSRLRIIVTGLIAQHPQMGGVAWDYVQFPLGLSRVGHDVFYFEDSGEWPYNLDGGASGDDWVARSPDRNLSYLSGIMDRFGLGDRWAYRFPLADSWHGLSDAKRRDVLESADLVINVSGTLEHPERYRRVPRMAYLDSDPLFTQLKILQHAKPFASRVDTHDVHFSFGESFSDATPVTNHRWLPTRQPIVLDEWPTDSAHRDVYSTVMNWTSYPPLNTEERPTGRRMWSSNDSSICPNAYTRPRSRSPLPTRNMSTGRPRARRFPVKSIACFASIPR